MSWLEFHFKSGHYSCAGHGETFIYFIMLVGEVVAFYEYLGIAYSGNVDIIGCT